MSNLPQTDEAKWCDLCAAYTEHYTDGHPKTLTNNNDRLSGLRDDLITVLYSIENQEISNPLRSIEVHQVQAIADDILSVVAAHTDAMVAEAKIAGYREGVERGVRLAQETNKGNEETK